MPFKFRTIVRRLIDGIPNIPRPRSCLRMLAVTMLGLVGAAGSAMAQGFIGTAVPGQVTEHLVRCGGLVRAVQIYLPSQYAALPPMPAVYALHGGGLNSRTMSNNNAGIKDAAEAHGFIAVFPNGSTRPGRPLTELSWGDDEVIFLDCLMSIVEGSLKVNTMRNYAVGFSGGGGVALQLAADPVTARRIAAVATSSTMVGKKPVAPPTSAWSIIDPTLATVSKVRGSQPRVPSNVSVLMLQGGQDPKHPVSGGYSAASDDINFSFQMAVDLFRLSIQAAVDNRPVVANVPARCEVHEYTSTANLFKVMSILDPDMGHEWPAKQNWPFMEVIWAFFESAPTR